MQTEGFPFVFGGFDVAIGGSEGRPSQTDPEMLSALNLCARWEHVKPVTRGSALGAFEEELVHFSTWRNDGTRLRVRVLGFRVRLGRQGEDTCQARPERLAPTSPAQGGDARRTSPVAEPTWHLGMRTCPPFTHGK